MIFDDKTILNMEYHIEIYVNKKKIISKNFEGMKIKEF